jgi:lysozyme
VKFRQDKQADTNRLIRKIRKWVIIILILNIVIIGLHAWYISGVGPSQIQHLFSYKPPVKPVVADKAPFNYNHEPYYYLGHSYQPDSLLDTVSFADHYAYYKQLIPDSAKNGIQGYYGMDVSMWQNSINWEQVRADTTPHPLLFFIIKATQGGSIIDPYFEHNWKEASGQQNIMGAYHFYDYKDNPIVQAENFIKTVHLSPGNLRPIIDVELACASCTKTGVPKRKMIENLKTFIAHIESHYKVKPILYTYSYFYTEYLKPHFNNYTFWMAQYSITPPTGMHIVENDTLPLEPPHIAMWQFTCKGRIDGVTGNVDLSFIPAYELTDLIIKQ